MAGLPGACLCMPGSSRGKGILKGSSDPFSSGISRGATAEESVCSARTADEHAVIGKTKRIAAAHNAGRIA